MGRGSSDEAEEGEEEEEEEEKEKEWEFLFWWRTLVKRRTAQTFSLFFFFTFFSYFLGALVFYWPDLESETEIDYRAMGNGGDDQVLSCNLLCFKLTRTWQSAFLSLPISSRLKLLQIWSSIITEKSSRYLKIQKGCTVISIPYSNSSGYSAIPMFNPISLTAHILYVIRCM